MSKNLLVEYIPFKPIGPVNEQMSKQYGVPGGLVVQGISTICTPVLINSISATVMHVGVEGSPTAARLLAAIQPMLTGNGANATVTAGEYRVV